MKIKLKKKQLILIGIVFLFVIIIVGTVKLRKKGIKVREIQIENKKVVKTVSANGTIESKNLANLSFLLTGKITAVNVEKGDFVKKGQILAQIDSTSQRETTQAAKDARDIALRNKEIYMNANSDNHDDSHEIQIRKYNELISQAEATYKAQSALLSNYTLRAPFDGTILEISAQKGEVATPASTIIQIADLENVYFEIDLDQEDFGNVKEGQAVIIHLDSYENDPFDGKVLKLTRYAQTTSAGDERFIVKIQIEKDTEKPISLGMTGNCKIIINQTKGEVTAIDYDVIFTDENDKEYIWILENGKLKKEYVETGLEGDLYTELITNVSEKTIVGPINGRNDFQEGLKAQVVER